MNQEDFETCIHHLIGLPDETEWVEWKQNYVNAEDIGEYISALSNSAALHRKSAGFLIWGIENNTHRIVGTSFKPKTEKVKGQEGLLSLLTDKIDARLMDRAAPSLRVISQMAVGFDNIEIGAATAAGS